MLYSDIRERGRMSHKTTGKKKKKFRFRKFMKITALYFVLFMALSGMVDYYALMEFSMTWFFVISLLAAVILGYLHTKSGKHDHADEVANELF